jgi:hypothetical protein
VLKKKKGRKGENGNRKGEEENLLKPFQDIWQDSNLSKWRQVPLVSWLLTFDCTNLCTFSHLQ